MIPVLYTSVVGWVLGLVLFKRLSEVRRNMNQMESPAS
jgi:hypothetical protein